MVFRANTPPPIALIEYLHGVASATQGPGIRNARTPSSNKTLTPNPSLFPALTSNQRNPRSVSVSDRQDQSAGKTDMKQNGEPNSVADDGNHANGDDFDGENRDFEINDADNDVEMSGEDDSDDEDVKDLSFGNDMDSVFDLRNAQLSLAKLSCSIGAPIGANKHFLNAMKGLNPLFQVPPSQYKDDVLQVFEEEKARAKGVLANLDARICLSVDTFSSFEDPFDRWEEGKSYYQLSAHFIDDNWKLKKWILKFPRAYSFEGEALDEAVLNGLKDWEIEGKVFSFTMAAADIDYDLVDTFRDCVQAKKKLPLDGKLFGVNCCARILDLMADDAYEEIYRITRKVEELISWKFAPVWYLPAYKLKEALELNFMGEFSKENIGDSYDVPSVEEWAKVRFVSNLVINLYEIVKTLFETKYPTANNFLHKFQEVRTMLYQEASSADDFKSKVGKKMLERLDKYWEEMNLTLAITSVMDPRFKMRYFDYMSSKGEINGNKLETSVILDAIRALYGDYAVPEVEKDYPVSDDSTEADSEENSEDEDEDESPPKAAADEEERRDSVQVKEYIQFIESINQPPKSDLDRYLEDPVLSWREDFNVLSWWRVEGAKYPTLSKMARDVLAIPMSVATSYDAYYKEREAHPRISGAGTDAIKNALMCAPTWAEKPQI